MAKINCIKSGLLYNIDGFNFRIESREFTHPIFAQSQKFLLSRIQLYFEHKLETYESYLLFLALLDSTKLIRWNCPATFTENTGRIIAQNMENLASVIGRINIIKHPHFQCPQISINRDTSTLENASVWIHTWNNAINSFLDGNRKQEIWEKIKRRERALDKLTGTNIRIYAAHLAQWAEEAADFPRTLTTTHNGERISKGEYWKEIIISCAKGQTDKYPKPEISALYDHCLDNLEVGTKYSHELFNILKNGLKSHAQHQAENLGMNMYSIVDGMSQEDEAVLIITLNAPLEKPLRGNYATAFEFIKALNAWNLSQGKKE